MPETGNRTAVPAALNARRCCQSVIRYRAARVMRVADGVFPLIINWLFTRCSWLAAFQKLVNAVFNDFTVHAGKAERQLLHPRSLVWYRVAHRVRACNGSPLLGCRERAGPFAGMIFNAAPG